MVKHAQTTVRQQLTNCFIVVDHFVGLTLKGFKCDYFMFDKLSPDLLLQLALNLS